MPSGVLVVSELDQDGVNSTTRELLAVGRKLADELGEELSAAVLAGAAGDLAQTLFSHGADKVYAVSHDLLQDYQADLQLAALEKVCTEASPNIILIGRTLIGREIAPRLAFRLGVGLAQDCLEVRIDDNGRLVANRPVYGGSCMASVTCMGSPQIAAIRPKVYEPLEGDPSRSGEVVDVAVELDPSMAKVKVVQVVREESAGIKLEDASIVISGGRGLGGPEPFKKLEEVAGILGAGVGASRAAVDSGWVPYSWQVGLTGKTITPELYITVGISGASQHMAGCSGAKVIVAINKDADANIFKEARYGVVGDWEKILPSFTEAVRELVNS